MTKIINQRICLFFISKKKSKKFLLYCYIEGFAENKRNIKVLLVMRADLTVIPEKILSSGEIINQYHGSLRSGSGYVIQTIDQVKDFLIIVDDRKIKIPGVIAKVDWDYIFLGWDGLMKHPHFLFNMWRKVTNKSSVKIKNITTEQPNELDTLLEKYSDLFATDIHQGLPRCNVGQHVIDTGDSNPIFYKPGKNLVHYDKKISEEVEKLYKTGLIVESESPWNTRIVPVTKPDGSLRMCLDFRPR